MTWQAEVKQVALEIRQRVFEHTINNKGGYLSQACSSADFLALLYTKILKLGVSIAPPIPRPFTAPPSASNLESFTGSGYHGAKSPEFDRFFISPAHYALVIYAALIATGRMDPKGLTLFNQDGSSVEMIGAEHSPGMEVTAGSLAQGLSMAAGVALARKLKKETGRVWVFISDGELQEGQTWETFAVIRHYRLNNLSIIVDVNGQQCDGAMSSVLDLGNLSAKLRAFGAQVIEVDGHNLETLYQTSRIQPTESALVLLAQTNPCQGMDYLETRRPKLHYVRFQSEQELQTLEKAIRKQLYSH